jgi:hypothetical protein
MFCSQNFGFHQPAVFHFNRNPEMTYAAIEYSELYDVFSSSERPNFIKCCALNQMIKWNKHFNETLDTEYILDFKLNLLHGVESLMRN